KDSNDFVFSVILREKPDVIVLDSLWQYPGVPLDDLATTVSRLRKAVSSRIVVVGPPVVWVGIGLPELILRYFANSNSLGPQPSRAYLREDIRDLDKTLEKKARDWGVDYVSTWDAMCDPDGCLMRVGPRGRDVTAFDNSHLTLAGSAFLADAIMPRLIDVGR